MPVIERIAAQEVLDSRGTPTLETDVRLKGGHIGFGMVPSGASTGVHEAVELRDGGTRYLGAGVRKTCEKVNKTIASKLVGKSFRTQKELDDALCALDGTGNKCKLGANALLSVSLAFARANASHKGVRLDEYIHSLLPVHPPVLPVPFSNVINGGKHAGTPLKFQEFMLVPHGTKTFAEATRAVCELYYALKARISSKYGKGATNVGDEGGFAPPITKPEEVLALMEDVVESQGYGKEVSFALDVAASEFHADGRYLLERPYSADELVDYYAKLIRDFRIYSIEDPFDEEDFSGFAALGKKIGKKAQIVGDDLLTTNVGRIGTAISSKSCNCLLLKVNQIGTLTEALDAARMAYGAKWNVMVSHRSGETEDAFIADLAVGIGCGQIKLGAPCRGERTAKYNQLLRLETLGAAKYQRAKK